MRVLVTGANGHIGCNLLPMLIEAGHEVVPFVRASSDTQGIDGLGLHYLRGDVQDAASLRDAAEGCDAIIHMAAVFSMANDPETIRKPAVEGARNVIEAAKAHGIKRVVYTSSTVSIGAAYDASKRTEADWHDDASLPYSIAKRDSERIATELAAEAGVELVILNPTGIIGPGDYRITPSSQYIVAMLSKQVPLGKGGMSFVDVRDVARAHMLALDHGAGGERHIVCDMNLDSSELMNEFDTLFGIRPSYVPFPRGLLVGSTVMAEAVVGLFGASLPFSANQAREYAGRWFWFDGSKAQRVLGLEYTPTRTTLLDTVKWLLKRDALPKKVAAKLRDRDLN